MSDHEIHSGDKTSRISAFPSTFGGRVVARNERSFRIRTTTTSSPLYVESGLLLALLWDTFTPTTMSSCVMMEVRQ